MKKLKWILLIFVVMLIIIIAFSSCKKTKALESVFLDNSYSISSNSQSDYGFVSVYYLGSNLTGYSYEFFSIRDHNNVAKYVLIAYENTLTVRSLPSNTNENYNISSNFLQVQVVEDLNSLYLIIYQVDFSIQQVQGVSPVVDGITRTMITRYSLDIEYNLTNEWNQNYISVVPVDRASYWTCRCLLNCSYIGYSDLPQDINNWVDNQFNSYMTFNKLLNSSYEYGVDDGYNDGYNVGYVEGEDNGYTNGYDDGEADGYLLGHADGMQEGLNQGYNEGYGIGYNDGYDDGEAGETAVSRTVTLLGSIFGTVGTVMSIELFPHVPLGLFFLVPLFFAVVGLILWIWRRN